MCCSYIIQIGLAVGEAEKKLEKAKLTTIKLQVSQKVNYCLARTLAGNTILRLQGRQSRSSRPSDHQTNVLTEIRCRWPFTCRQETRISPPQIHACTTSWSDHKRELQRPENEQVLSMVATHSRWALFGIGYMLSVKQNFDWHCAPPFHNVPGVPETANADGHQFPSVRTSTEPKFSYHCRTKVKT